MNINHSRYHRHRFPAVIIGHVIWFYHRFNLSLRDIEDLMAERGVIVSYETIYRWCANFGPEYARRVRRRLGPGGDVWHLDEMVVSIQGKRHYLWRAVD
jgi:putative transposase